MTRTRPPVSFLVCAAFASFLTLATSAGAQDRFVFDAPPVTGLLPGSWNLVGIDFPGDGATDLFVARTSGDPRLMLGTNDSGAFTFATWPAGPLISATTRLQIGDFDGDGLGDLFVYDTASGYIQVALRNPTGWGLFTVWAGPFTPTTGWKFTIGDFSGDGKDDVMAYYEPTGALFIGITFGPAFLVNSSVTVSPAAGWLFAAGPVAGGSTDWLVGYHPSNDTLWAGPLAGLQFQLSLFGNTTGGGWKLDQLFAGDFNRDGRSDMLGYDASNGDLVVGLSNGTSFAVDRWGGVPAAGDWRFAVGAFKGIPQPDVAAFNATSQVLWVAENVQRQCSNGFDDDDDGLVDYPADTRCQSPADNDEKRNPGCGLGGELVLVVGLLFRYRRRGASSTISTR